MADPQFHPSNPQMNPALREWIDKRIDGKSMRRLKIERESLLKSLKATGLAQPATILNFNPIALTIDGGLADFKVPSIVDPFVKDSERIRVKYKGREFKASLLTIREPRIFTQIKDVKKEDDVEVGEYDPKPCKQIEIAYGFLTSYTFGTASSSGMGGVVVFEGDRHVLEHDFEDLQIKVPEHELLPNRSYEYFTNPKSFMECVAYALDLQKTYSNVQTQMAQSFHDGDADDRKNITDIHRVWHQYELDMLYRDKAAPWITLQNEPSETCTGCGQAKKRAEAYFCTCGRPYDVLKAYLAGELPFDSSHMARLNDADWTKVEAEEQRRIARRRRAQKAPEPGKGTQ